MKMLQRILALLGAVCLLGLAVLTFILGLMGSKYFMASLYAMIIVPVFIYGYMIVIRAFSSKEKEEAAKSAGEKKEEKEEKLS